MKLFHSILFIIIVLKDNIKLVKNQEHKILKITIIKYIFFGLFVFNSNYNKNLKK